MPAQEWATSEGAAPDETLTFPFIVKVDGETGGRWLFHTDPTYVLGFSWLASSTGVATNLKAIGLRQVLVTQTWFDNMTATIPIVHGKP